ncbi:Crp/Fnr family transcriptional regulator [Vallitalea okinawensis]|uniref:Crp/Fnr family transcriptional regulator n=1 Tax=Vallitalea okinawensis TaxID=2078660 RepID=UPI000CFC4BBA|nr:Crp/Fnr family transcriptional regulator [Vallitalea okinawensis]
MNDRMLISKYLKEFQLEEVLSEELITNLTLQKHNSGDYILAPLEHITSLSLLVRGNAKVFTIGKNGHAYLLRFYKPLEIIGEVEWLLKQTSSCIVEALEECHTLNISFSSLKQYTDDNCPFYRFISTELAKKLAKSSKASSINSLFPLENRLASYIISIPSTNTSNSISNTVIELPQLQNVAELLGTSYRHLLRTLRSLESKGLLKQNRNRITILDYTLLKDLAGDLYE